MKTFAKRLAAVLLAAFCMFPTVVSAESAHCGYCYETCPYTLEYEPWGENVHCIRWWCSLCGYDQNMGCNLENHTMRGGSCTKCGYSNIEECTHDVTYTDWDGCDWYEYCNDCDELMDSGTSHGSTYTEWNGCDWYDYCRDCDELMDSGTSHGSYSYSAWEYYSTSRHRCYYSCEDCGEGSYTYGSHSTATEYTSYSSSQHTVGSYCSTCDSYVGSASYENHDFTYGSWSKYSSSQHRRSVSCYDCGYSNYEYAGHSLTYGSWTEYSDTQHSRTNSCSCGYSTTEYGSHSDTDNNGECDSCGYGMSYFSVTVPAVMMLAVSETGEVTAADNAVIINNSSAAVVVSDVTILSADGWTIVPYETNMADEKVNANLIGFRIENIRTTDYGDSESFAGNWTLDSGDELSLDYDAVVSAASHAITDEQVLTVIFVIEWAA